MELHIKILGVLLMGLALLHVIFPRYFNWKQELGSLTMMNRQMMHVHSFFIALTVFLMGLLCFTSPQDLITTTLGKKISLGMGIFWGARLIIQFFGYSSEIWKGKIFETTIHILFSMFWAYLCVIFIWIFIAS